MITAKRRNMAAETKSKDEALEHYRQHIAEAMAPTEAAHTNAMEHGGGLLLY